MSGDLLNHHLFGQGLGAIEVDPAKQAVAAPDSFHNPGTVQRGYNTFVGNSQVLNPGNDAHLVSLSNHLSTVPDSSLLASNDGNSGGMPMHTVSDVPGNGSLVPSAYQGNNQLAYAWPPTLMSPVEQMFEKSGPNRGTSAGIYVNYPGFPITVPDYLSKFIPKSDKPTTTPLWHAGVIAVDPNGGTRYYEYGRYNHNDFGQVRRLSIPNLQFDQNEDYTNESLKRIQDTLMTHARNELKSEGKNYQQFGVNFNIHPGLDHQKIIEYAEGIKNNPNRKPYNWNPMTGENDCKTFAQKVLDAGKK